MHDVEIKNMIKFANEAKQRSYAPYSTYHVGACVKGESGAYYQGCNIENASYGLSNCAERTAIFKGVSECEKEFVAVSITGDGDDFAMPCGACRQVMTEFCKKDATIIISNNKGEYKVFTLEELIPHSFSKENLG